MPCLSTERLLTVLTSIACLCSRCWTRLRSPRSSWCSRARKSTEEGSQVMRKKASQRIGAWYVRLEGSRYVGV
jgi:hypothetical protein